MRKKGQMHFAWIFAIIIGAVILFLTFFFLGREIFVQEQKTTVELTRGLDLLFGPFNYLGSIAEASSDEIILYEKTKIDFDCKSQGLGYSIMSIVAKKQTINYDIYDKYIFAENMETKNITLISKPFKMPFRIADLIFLAPQQYCFVDAPNKIERELNNLDLGFEFYNSINHCDEESIKVCFGTSSGSCNVKVRDKCGLSCEYENGEVVKGSKKMNYATTSLMYGAIFSSKEVYDCQLERLMERLDLLIRVYREKARDLNTKGCLENYVPMLSALDNTASDLEPGELDSIQDLYGIAQQLDNLNIGATCSLY